MEGSICIRTNLDVKQTPFIMFYCGMYPIRGLNDLFLGPKYRKLALEKHPFCRPFQGAPSRAMV